MAKMTEDVLLGVIETAVSDTTAYDDSFMQANEDLLDRYLGNPYGDEKPNQSKVISNDVMDLVEADMPSLSRIFLGSGEVIKFKPNNRSNKEDVAEADQKSKYVDWQVRKQPWSFRTLFGWMKNAEIFKTSVVKYYIEETTEVEEHQKYGLSEEEIAIVLDSLNGEDVTEVEITERGEVDELGRMDVKFKVNMTRKCVKIRNIPLENFLITRNAECKDDAIMVGDREFVSRGELLARGYSKKLVESLRLSSEYNSKISRLKDIRDEDEGGQQSSGYNQQGETGYNDWALEIVELQDLYILVDYDGDGIAERRHIIRSGDDILENEMYGHVPYALLSTVIMPHKAIGLSRAEIAAPTARIKTSILRGINNNIHAVNHPRTAINTNINKDDLLDGRIDGLVRSKTEGPIGNDIMPMMVPYIGDKALQVIQYWDQSRAQTTGSLMASQGLEADDLNQETATRFNGIQDASEAKVELVARCMAETGWRELYEGIAWLDANYQDTEQEIDVTGEELRVNPADWKRKHYASSQVGLGVGDDEKLLQSMTALMGLHQQLQATGSPLTDQVKVYNTLDRIIKGLGLADTTEFFNNPERPDQLIQAENEMLKSMLQQMQMQMQQMGNPLAEVEQVRAQAKLIEANSKAQIDIAKLQEQQRQFNIETQQKQEQANKELALKLTELEAKMKQQFNAQFKQNEGTTGE